MTIPTLTDHQISGLRELPKKVENPRARQTFKAKHSERNFDVVSDDRRQCFRLIVRQSTKIPTNFSCGLLWLPPGFGQVMLTRYNGSDHEHRNVLEGDEFGFVCHIHLATERYIGAMRKPEHFAQPTDRYATLDGALACLTSDWNIMGLTPRPFAEQLPLS